MRTSTALYLDALVLPYSASTLAHPASRAAGVRLRPRRWDGPKHVGTEEEASWDKLEIRAATSMRRGSGPTRGVNPWVRLRVFRANEEANRLGEWRRQLVMKKKALNSKLMLTRRPMPALSAPVLSRVVVK